VLGAGLDGIVRAIAVRGREVFVGGDFLNAGKTPSLHFARWTYANQKPEVTLVRPKPGEVFVAPSDLVLEAVASDSDGTVREVGFFAGTNFIGRVTAAPYVLTWTNVGAGVYSISASATDDGGAQSVSSTVVIVVKTNQAPRVGLLWPTNDAVFLQPLDLPISVEVFDPDGKIAQVELLANSNSIGVLHLAPYAPYGFVWTNVPAGGHELQVVAVDDRGLAGYSGKIRIQVQSPEPINLSVSGSVSVGGLNFALGGQQGGTVVVEASTNLIEWLPILTNTFVTGTIEFVDPDVAAFDWRFYRARYSPWR
jgi:hypothetical protein